MLQKHPIVAKNHNIEYTKGQGLGVKMGELVIFRHYFMHLDTITWWKIRLLQL
jgi:hypothetical protein